jgi:hypothetical protein
MSAARAGPVVPCPRRDAGAVRCGRRSGHRLQDRGRAADARQSRSSPPSPRAHVATPGPSTQPRLPSVNATRANGGTRWTGTGWSRSLRAITCRIAARRLRYAVAPCPPRDAGALRCVGVVAHHLPDRGQPTTHVGRDHHQHRPVPTSRRRNRSTGGITCRIAAGSDRRRSSKCELHLVHLSVWSSRTVRTRRWWIRSPLNALAPRISNRR